MPKSRIDQIQLEQVQVVMSPLTQKQTDLTKWVFQEPVLWQKIDPTLFQPAPTGKPRSQMTVPIAAAAQVQDHFWYEDPANPAVRYYLPRYRLATQRVSGTPQYRVRLSEVNAQWRLAITLEAFAAPELGSLPSDARILPHDLSARLRWEIPNTNGATRQVVMSERLDNPDGTRSLAFVLNTLAERDDLYTALTSQRANTALWIERQVQVAVPTNAAPVGKRSSEPVSRAGMLSGVDQMTLLRPGLDLTSVVTPISVVNPVLAIDPNRMTVNPVLIEAVVRPNLHELIKVRPELFDRFRPTLATPELELTGSEIVEVRGETWVRYQLRVKNWQAYPDALFAASPDLPPCGKNSNAARTWVDIFDNNNQRIYGFCALGKASDLERLWVATALTKPLAGIYIELNDRRAGLSARSNTVIPPVIALYQEVTTRVDMSEALFFHPDLHSYIFPGLIQHAPATQGLLQQTANYQGRQHLYFQDAVQPHRFYYLPEAFKLARRPDGTHPPLLRLELLSAEPEQYRLTWFATPYVDWDRLEAAENELRSAVPAGHPTALSLEPFQTSAVTFVPAAPHFYREGSSATINLGTVQASVTLARADFTTVWDELNGALSLSLGGKLQVAVQGFPTQEIPVNLRLDDTVGELLAITTAVDAAAGGYRLTLKNAIESPMQIQTLGGFVQSLRLGLTDVRPAIWRELTLPGEPLPPSGQFQALLAPPVGAALADFAPLIDTDQVRVLPDSEAIFNAIVASSVREYERPVTVQVPSTIFNQPSGKVLALQVSFVGGATLSLTPPSDPSVAIVSATIPLPYPLKDVLLGKAVRNWYQYSVVVVWADGKVSSPSEEKGGEANSFFLHVPQLSA